MAAKRRSKPGAAKRPQGAVAPPTATSPAVRRKAAAQPLPAPSRFTRDKLLGWGAAVCALLAAAGLSLAGLITLLGLGYLAAAFLRPADRRDRSLGLSGWTFALAFLLGGVFSNALMLSAADAELIDSTGVYGGLTSMRIFIGLSIIGWLALCAGAALFARAFSHTGPDRYRLLSRTGLCIAAYFLLDIPRAIAQTSAAPVSGKLWEAPVAYGSIVLGAAAGLIIYCAFAWFAPVDSSRGRLRYAHREYLLAAAAVLLLVPRLIGLGMQNWNPSTDAAEANTTISPAYLLVAYYLSSLILPVFYAATSAGLLISCRRAGWTTRWWLTGQSAPDTHVAASAAAAAEGAAPLGWARSLLLTWRLPLLSAWLLLLVAACSIAGYLGFLTAAPAALHYLVMMRRRS